MTAGAEDTPETRGSEGLSRAAIAAVLVASLVAGALAITAQSYWIDEAMSLLVATAPGPTDACRFARAVGAPALQAPAYHAYLYVWHKAFGGGGEWAMRASNLPWFALAQLAFLLVLRHRPRLALAASLLAAVSPVIWTYLDETRPYAMQYAAACWLSALLARAALGPEAAPGERLWHRFAGASAILVLFACGPDGLVWGACFLLAMTWLRISAPPDQQSAALQSAGRGRIVFAFLLGVIATYQALVWPGWADADSNFKAFVQGALYTTYEFLGFAGFGPGKLELRAAATRSVLRHLPAMLPLGACLAVMIYSGLRAAAVKGDGFARRAAAWFIAVIVPVAFLLGAALALDQHPTPRDFVPALPPLLLALGAAMLFAIGQRSLLLRGAAVALPVLWLGSSLNLRRQGTYAKDDYRKAAEVAAAALRQDRDVWWAADAAAAHVYLTPASFEQSPGRAWAMQGPNWNDIRFKFPPRMIVISRPDIYDPRGAVMRYAAENHFAPALELQGITVLTRPDDPLPVVP